MSQQLPPYSTFRTDRKQLPYPHAQSNGNVLAFTPPGFSQTLWVKFSDSRLAVCDRCKKNFKTREMCRVKNRHSTPPWTTAYLCVTVDDSCLDDHGKFRRGDDNDNNNDHNISKNDELTVRMVQWQPYCVAKPFDAKTPVCASCKKTNRTRSYCRERHKHRLLPWNTVYVLLSTLKSVDPSTVVAKPDDTAVVPSTCSSSTCSSPAGAESTDGGGDGGGGSSSSCCNNSGSSTKSDNESLSSPQFVFSKSSESCEADVASTTAASIIGCCFTDTDTIASDNNNEQIGDDIHDVAESRTFLALVSSRGTSIHWLELGTVLDPSAAADAGPTPSPLPLDAAPMNNGCNGYGSRAATVFDFPLNPAMFNATTAAAASAMNNYAAQQQQHALKHPQQLFFQQQLMAGQQPTPVPPPLFTPPWPLPVAPFCFGHTAADGTTPSDAFSAAAQMQQQMQQLQQQQQMQQLQQQQQQMQQLQQPPQQQLQQPPQQQLQLQLHTTFEPGNKDGNHHHLQLHGAATPVMPQFLPVLPQYPSYPQQITPPPLFGMIDSTTTTTTMAPVSTTPIMLQQWEQQQLSQPYPLSYGSENNVPANDGQHLFHPIAANYQTTADSFNCDIEETEPSSKRRRS